MAKEQGTDRVHPHPEVLHLDGSADTALLRLSVVIPVYRGEQSLPALMDEIAPLTAEQRSPNGTRFTVCEVLLVHDCGPDRSDLAIEAMAARHAFVRPVWLSRNYGQHGATLAGMASATGDWVVTIDEDGQQNPADIGTMLDAALAGSLQLVYAKPLNPPPHGWLRNALSVTAKAISSKLLGNNANGRFNSFRLVDGEIARTLAAFCGSGVYLDVGLFWVAGRIGHCPVELRQEADRPSGYSYIKLFGHFWNLVLTTGTRPLRLITITGILSMLGAFAIAAYAMYGKYQNQVPVQGWASLVIVVAFFSGSILMALGVIAEYLAVTMGNVMGKPLYMVSSKPTRSSRHLTLK
jgi:undecaprenyl-phosphate 4-deoxy-4-formamido-L-arabinose transferase